MKHYRIRFLKVLGVFILLISTTATAKPALSQNAGILTDIQADNRAIAPPASVKAPGVEDIPTLLARAGIPLENLQPLNLAENLTAPMAEGDYLWHTFYGSTGWDVGWGIAVDGSGGVYISGYSASSWDGPEGQAPLHAHSGGVDIAVLKLDAAGTYQWHTFYGSTNHDYSHRIAVDGNSGVYIVACSWEAWNGPEGQAPLNAHSGGDRDITVLKLDAAGAYQWHTFYGSIDVDEDSGIVVDGSGGVYVSGASYSSWIGPASQEPLNAHSGNGEITVLKLNAAGAYQWHTFYGSTDGDRGVGIAVDGSSGVYITGYSNSSWKGPIEQEPLHAHSGSGDFAVLKLDAAGAYQWHTFFGSIEQDSGLAIILDSIGGVYITGNSVGSWDGPAGQAPLHTFSVGEQDITVIKLDTAGAYQWHTFYGSVDSSPGIAVDSSGGVYICSSSFVSWSGPANQEPLHAHSGAEDLAVLKLDASGAYQWHTFYGATGDDECSGLAVDGSGGVYAGGSSVITWNGPAGQVPLHANSAGNDITVLKLEVPTTPVQADFIALPTFGIAPLTVVFTNTSSGIYTSTLWEFGDGITATLESPTHTYSAPGVYTVTLTVTGTDGTDTEMKDSYITAYAAVQADFSATPTSGVAPLDVAFTNRSSGDYTTSLWDFGDGITGTQQHPIHTYTGVGVYTVTLTVNGFGGTDTLTQTNYITVVEGTQTIVDPTTGGTLVYTDTQGVTTTIQIPAGAVTETITLIYTVVDTITAPSGLVFAGHAFDLNAYQDGVLLPGFTFLQPVTITIYYTDADIAGLDENSLKLYYLDNGTWKDVAQTCTPPSTYERHPGENWFSIPICHLSRFALFGKEFNIVYLPQIRK